MEAAKECEVGGLAETLLGDGDVDGRVWVGLVLFSLMAAVAGRGGTKAIGANSRIQPKQEEWWRTPMAGCRWAWSFSPRSLQSLVAAVAPRPSEHKS